MSLADNPAFAIWCASLAFLAIKMFMNSTGQAVVRLRHKQFVTPEDARVYARAEAADDEHEMVKRFERVWGNDLENIPAFLIVSLGFVLAGGDRQMTLIYCATFGLARLLHSVSYVMKLQPWRTLCYSVGLGASFGCLGHLLVLVTAP